MPFIISKSTFPGIGRYAGHLVDLYDCSWESMKMTVTAILNFQLFGIRTVGFEICP